MAFLHHLIYPFQPDFSENFRYQILTHLTKNISQLKRSHRINGRWENLYLDPDNIPEVKQVFSAAAKYAKDITEKPLIVPHKGLGFPINEFWFNVAKPGEKTGWHDHKKNAVISGVYYLKVPKNSGDIHFRKKEKESWKEYSINSEPGKMILFNSVLEHSVSKNRSADNRISLAFNLYTLPLELAPESTEYSAHKFFS